MLKGWEWSRVGEHVSGRRKSMCKGPGAQGVLRVCRTGGQPGDWNVTRDRKGVWRCWQGPVQVVPAGPWECGGLPPGRSGEPRAVGRRPDLIVRLGADENEDDDHVGDRKRVS